MKRRLAAALCAALLLTAGCSGGGDENDMSGVIVAHIENPPEDAGTHFDISYADWHGEYAFYMARQGYTEEDNPEEAADYRESVLETQMEERIVLYLAEKAGISPETLTEEEKQSVDDSVKESRDGWCESYENDAKSAFGDESYTDEELYEKEYELFKEFMNECGLEPEIFITWEQNALIQEKYIAYVSETEISDEDVNALVQETVDDAKDKYENDLETFENSYTAFYVPEGSRVVQQIFVSFGQDAINEIKAYRDDGDDEKADELLAAAQEKVRFRVDEAYEKLENGGDWFEVQEEYNDDTNGSVDYNVYPKSSTVMPEITEAALSIPEKGGYSDILATDSGFFILYYKDDLSFSDEYMNDLKDQAREYLENQAAYQKIAEFKEQYPYVCDYETLNIEETAAEETTAAE